ncbi:MAG: isoprenoid biosynthesis glyoxalase ElbB [Oleiphilaceae bacterium]|nr:isoprenoid biosynthesis glyoxalase ElbB [Oleiphilaceae bacterium]
MKKIGLVLSGCGVFDGAEIHESVICMMEILRQGASYECFAPNQPQHHVINHLNGEEMPENRNVMVEAARIARGEVTDLAEADAAGLDALILPGGFGAAKNLSDFAFKGSDCQVSRELTALVKAMHEAGKPVGFVCIAPVMIPKILGPGVSLTIGSDQETAAAITAMGGEHKACSVSEFVVDEAHKIVSTPAYMLAGNILEAESGIKKLVQEVLRLSA